MYPSRFPRSSDAAQQLETLTRRNRAASLGTYFKRLARASFAATALAGCSTDNSIDLSRYEIVACEDVGATSWVTGTVDSREEALLVVQQAGYQVGCSDVGTGGIRDVSGGYEVVATRTRGGCSEPWIFSRHLLFVDSAGTVTPLAAETIDENNGGACPGRRPPGMEPDPRRAAGDVGGTLARAATFEAASVDAFLILGQELEHFGAPSRLIAEARCSADDEARHAQAMTHLARRYGVEPEKPRRHVVPLRSLYDVALDNATEGCVRETFSALTATFQSVAAEDEAIARVMGPVAEDETRHAAFSWQLDEWIVTRLTSVERETVNRARAQAVADLRRLPLTACSNEVARIAGLPGKKAAIALVDELEKEIWS